MTAQKSTRLMPSNTPRHPSDRHGLKSVSSTEPDLVSLLRELHDDLDRAVFDAYGWNDLADRLVGRPGATTPLPDKPADQAEAEEELLSRLVALNAERAAEEAQGHIRWLRPDYQALEATQTTATLEAKPEAAAETPNRTCKKAHLAQIHARPGRSRLPPPRDRPPDPGSSGQPLQAETNQVDHPGPRRPTNPRPGHNRQRPLAPDMTNHPQHQESIARPCSQTSSTAAGDNTVLKTAPATHLIDSRPLPDPTRPTQYPIKHARTFIRYPRALSNHC